MGRSNRSMYLGAGRILAALLAILTGLVACGRPAEVPENTPTSGGRSSPAGSNSQQTPPPEGSLKEVGKGLYLKEKLPPAGMEFIDHVVITGDWREFEPENQQFNGPGWDRLAGMLDNPMIKVRLRIQAGIGSPQFVKKLGGPPVSGDGIDCSEEGGIAISKRPATGDGVALAASEGCVPYFWTGEVLEQYEELMEEVGRRYESNPRLLDVVDSACTTFFAEPFIRAGRSRTTNARLFEAGLNQRTDEACLRRSVEIHDQVFRTTRVSLATHSAWQIISDPEKVRAGVTTSWDLERALLEDLRRQYGAKLVVQNNGLGGDEGCGRGEGGDSNFCWLASAAPPKGFQTEGEKRLTTRGQTVLDAVARAVEMGACFVEHNQFGTDAAAAKDYDELLKDNC